MAQVPITIDGRRIEVEEGSYVLQAATALGIEIPTLCYYKYVTPYAACRICCVEVKDRRGRMRVVTSCNYPAEAGIEVFTHTPRVIASRRLNFEMLASRCAPMPVLTELGAKLGIESPAGAGARTRASSAGCACVSATRSWAPRRWDSPRGAPPATSRRRSMKNRAPASCAGPARRSAPRGTSGWRRRATGRSSTARSISVPTRPSRYRSGRRSPTCPGIDPEYCVHFRTGGCRICAQVCPKECIDHEDEERIEEVEVGTVILATGFQDLDPTPLEAVRLRPAAAT